MQIEKKTTKNVISGHKVGHEAGHFNSALRASFAN